MFQWAELWLNQNVKIFVLKEESGKWKAAVDLSEEESPSYDGTSRVCFSHHCHSSQSLRTQYSLVSLSALVKWLLNAEIETHRATA